MKRVERLNSLQDSLREVLKGKQRELWTALPAVIQSFDPTTQTCTAQPTIQIPLKQEDGSWVWTTLPLLLDVPVEFPSGGGFTLTFPVKAGDECLVKFASRCIDAWWAYGGIQTQPELRMHDLSDGIAFVGIRSQANLLTAISTVSAQLRSDDGATVIDLAPGAITLTAPLVTVDGNLVVTGTVNGTTIP